MFGQQPAPATFMEEVNQSMTMGFTKRIMLFIVCLLLGAGFIFLSTFFVVVPRTFAKFYTFGNLCLMGSSFFLVGPSRQFRTMFTKERAISSIVYLTAMMGTLYAALVLQNWILSFLLACVQMCATIWYGASYIPYAQSLLWGATSTCLPTINSPV